MEMKTPWWATAMSSLKKMAKSLLEFVFLRLAHGSRWLASLAHFGLYIVQWGIKPTPEWFDHNLDAYWQWPKKKNSSWLERGFFNSLCLEGGSALELTCGDGFYTSRFYARKLKNMVACDRDAKAIASARKYSSADNVNYVVADILTSMPSGEFNHVIWDFGFPWCDHFTAQQVDAVVVQAKGRLCPNGVFSGYLALLSDPKERGRMDSAGEVSFRDIGALKAFLQRHFAHTCVIETSSPGRRNAYFYASDGIVPFNEGWIHRV
jgi:2-polyprenyl-3-methyl-5-hydroxy-6-metoxy-1,4-benzoquinol methylase